MWSRQGVTVRSGSVSSVTAQYYSRQIIQQWVTVIWSNLWVISSYSNQDVSKWEHE